MALSTTFPQCAPETTKFVKITRLNPPTGGGVPWEPLRKIFSECQWMAKVPNGEDCFAVAYTGWAKKVIPLLIILHCTRGITLLAHPV